MQAKKGRTGIDGVPTTLTLAAAPFTLRVSLSRAGFVLNAVRCFLLAGGRP